MKKNFCLLLCTVLLLCSLTGCGSDTDNSSAPSSEAQSSDSSNEPELVTKEITLCYNSQDSLNPVSYTHLGGGMHGCRWGLPPQPLNTFSKAAWT